MLKLTLGFSWPLVPQASSHSSEDRFDFDRELEKVRQRVAKASAVVEDVAPAGSMTYALAMLFEVGSPEKVYMFIVEVQDKLV